MKKKVLMLRMITIQQSVSSNSSADSFDVLLNFLPSPTFHSPPTRVPLSSTKSPHPAYRDDPPKALAAFQKIVTSDTDKGEQTDFGFKSLKQMTKLTFKLGRYSDALSYYKLLLSYTKKGVTRNVAEKSINGILDYVSNDTNLETGKMQEFYEVTKEVLEEAKNERLSTKINLKLAKLWLDRKEFGRLNKVSISSCYFPTCTTPQVPAFTLATLVCRSTMTSHHLQLSSSSLSPVGLTCLPPEHPTLSPNESDPYL